MRIMILLMIILSVFLIGCQQIVKEKDPSPFMKLSTHDQYEQTYSNEVKRRLQERDELSVLHVVNDGQNIVIGFDVDHHHRFQLRKIEHELKELLTKDYPKHKVTISTDQKIILELSKLEKDLHEQRVSKKEIEKRLEKIIYLTTDEA